MMFYLCRKQQRDGAMLMSILILTTLASRTKPWKLQF